jgi:predicted transcriptional regulator
MDPIYPLTALQKNPRAVRDEANKSIVHITENGSAAYVFCSEAVLEERIRKERADAAWEARLSEAIGRGLADIEAGKFVVNIEEAFEKAAALGAARG